MVRANVEFRYLDDITTAEFKALEDVDATVKVDAAQTDSEGERVGAEVVFDNPDGYRNNQPIAWHRSDGYKIHIDPIDGRAYKYEFAEWWEIEDGELVRKTNWNSPQWGAATTLESVIERTADKHIIAVYTRRVVEEMPYVINYSFTDRFGEKKTFAVNGTLTKDQLDEAKKAAVSITDSGCYELNEDMLAIECTDDSFSYWEVRKSADGDVVARSYSPLFDLCMMDSYYITPVCEGKPDDSAETEKDPTVTLTHLDYTRNRWTDESGAVPSSGDTDLLFTDFEIAFEDNGAQIYGADSEYTAGVVFEKIGTLAESATFTPDKYNYYSEPEALKAAILNNKTSYSTPGTEGGTAKNRKIQLSAIDTAKGIAHGAANPDTPLWELWTKKVPLTRSLPVGAVLTMPAAGSEMSDSAVLTNTALGRKAGINTEFNRCRFAVMNPEWGATLPRFQLAAGVTDIMMHTMERYFIPDVIKNGAIVVKDPSDYDAMAEVFWASSLSHNNLTECGRGKDFSVHKLGHPLSARFGVTHGASLAAVWGAWAEELYRDCPSRFARFARRVWSVAEVDDLAAAKAGINKTVDFFSSIGMPVSLQELNVGITEADMPQLSLDATLNDTLKLSRIRPLTAADAERIYRRALRSR